MNGGSGREPGNGPVRRRPASRRRTTHSRRSGRLALVPNAERIGPPRSLSDRYTLVRELGSGLASTVFLAEDLRYNRSVAVKVLRAVPAEKPMVDRFLREAQTLSRLHHPNVLPLYDSGESDGIPYYVMPFVEDGSLGDRLRREKQLPIDDVVRIGREVAEALAYAHSRGIVHRDIKPDNILMCDGHAVVADFGIARPTVRPEWAQPSQLPLTSGTPLYMSPEQCCGQDDPDARSDIYSLGCLLYELLTGEPPFTGATVRAVLARHLHEHPRSVKIVRPSTPQALQQVVARALAKLPADRFNSAAVMADALGRCLSMPTSSGVDWRWAVVFAIGVAMAVAAGVA